MSSLVANFFGVLIMSVLSAYSEMSSPRSARIGREGKEDRVGSRWTLGRGEGRLLSDACWVFIMVVSLGSCVSFTDFIFVASSLTVFFLFISGM